MSGRAFSVFWVNEGTSPTIMGNFLIHDGTSAQKADITSISYKVYDVDDATAVVIEGDLAKADVFFDTLQTDARWTIDSTGFNFAWPAPATICPDSGKRYRVQFTTTPAVGTVIKDAVILPTRPFSGE